MSTELLSQRVYDWLLGRILACELKPGDRINRRDVADQVGVSVAPTLEAMVQLEWEGFLETRPRLGTRVRVVDAEEVRGRFILREALEAQGARLYCGHPVKQHEKQLLKLANAVDRSSPRSSTNWNVEIDFHRALMALTNCPVLIDAFDHVLRHSLFYAINRLLPPPRRRIAPNSHARLIRQLQVQDPDKAEQAIRAHVQARWFQQAEDAAKPRRNGSGG